MNDVIVKLFGVNRMNLFGWCAAGLIVIGLAVLLMVEAAIAAKNATPELMLLGAIAVLLLGIFGVLLQIYCALLAEKIERGRKERRYRDDD